MRREEAVYRVNVVAFGEAKVVRAFGVSQVDAALRVIRRLKSEGATSFTLLVGEKSRFVSREAT